MVRAFFILRVLGALIVPGLALAQSEIADSDAAASTGPFSGWQVWVALGAACFAGYLVGLVLGGRRPAGASSGGTTWAGSRDSSIQDTRLRVAQERVTDLTAKNQDLMKFFVNFPEQVKKLNSSLEVQDVTAIVVRMTVDMLKAEEVSFFLLNRPKGVLQLVELAGLPRELKGTATVPIGSGVIGWMIDQVTVRDGSEYVGAVLGVSEAATDMGSMRFKTALAAPIILRDQALGVINLGKLEKTTLSEKRVLAMIADLTAIALANAFHIGKAKEEANVDGMTKLYNHKYFKVRLAQELGRAATFGTTVSVFLFDVDNFKHYNDTNGHPAGDEVLKKIAALVRSRVRHSDLVARYGGEEFVVMLIGAEKERAFVLAEQIRALIEKSDFPFGDRQPLGRVSISGGVAAYPADSSDLAELVKCADEALYEAKRGGRNRVLTYAKSDKPAATPLPPKGGGPATPAPQGKTPVPARGR